jgi:hypothetical protein
MRQRSARKNGNTHCRRKTDGPQVFGRDATVFDPAIGEIETARYYRAVRDEAENETPAIQHVKDGKPLTAIGARLLGVPWNGDK